MKKNIITIVVMVVVSIAGGFGLVNNAKIENRELIVQEEVENIKQEDEDIAENNFENEESITETEVVSESSSNVINNQTSSVSSNSNKQVSKQEVRNIDTKKSEEENYNGIISSKQEQQTIQETPNGENKSNVTTTFYDSITGGKKEFSSEGACRARGTQIQDNELNYVLDYNEQHPDNPIQPDINYFRCYPVIDGEGEGWYLHFFCKSGEGNDEKLKNMY